VVENRHSPLLWPLAYTTACTCTNSTSRDSRSRQYLTLNVSETVQYGMVWYSRI